MRPRTAVSRGFNLGSLLKVIGANVVIAAAMLAALNLISKVIIDYHAIIFDVVANLGDGAAGTDESGSGARGSLAPNWMMNPNYEDRERAATIFNEFEQLDTEYRPFVGWSRLPFDGEAITVDESGDRIHRADQARGADQKVAHFFGGSTMWGTGSDDDHTIAALFDAARDDYRVFNHGEAGFNSRQSVARLVNLFNQGADADLVVFYDGANEVFSLCRSEVSLNGHLREQEIRNELRASAVVTALRDVFVRHTVKLASIMRRKLGGVSKTAYRCAADPEYTRRVAQTMVNNWIIAYDLTVARGGRFIGILQPVAYIGDARVDHLRNNLAALGGLGEEFEAVYPIVTELIQEYDYMYDLSDAFDGDEFVYIDFCHVSPNGNRIISSAIERIAESSP